MPLPRKFREQLKDSKGGKLAKGADKCIVINPLGEWIKQAAELEKAVRPSDVQRKLRRLFGASTFDFIFDSQGRIALPAELRNYAEITDSAVVIGAQKYVEIWNPDLWEEQIGEWDHLDELSNMKESK
ncbi:Transcriptional regulator MraZ [subsurface metagenome]